MEAWPGTGEAGTKPPLEPGVLPVREPARKGPPPAADESPASHMAMSPPSSERPAGSPAEGAPREAARPRVLAIMPMTCARDMVPGSSPAGLRGPERARFHRASRSSTTGVGDPGACRRICAK
ncbi:hypothetical protein H696_02710 [Fonticula alba]|uniref:Uncharacterized protein n=1 Tax=Fonticula alba TaxID=691883 RepID=A0A058Z8C9_FONAL|nr:hypothetical protein H696_02710 [Fonticula alba]KCV70376.1 hypothetical protein H696_02710 [Fonticula alba]|eukprot:XP_009494892.1 hypothetical protein H696_02710 [Fonticula alba]